MEYKSIFTWLLITFVTFGASIVILTLSETCFKQSGTSPETYSGSHLGSCNIGYKKPTETKESS